MKFPMLFHMFKNDKSGLKAIGNYKAHLEGGWLGTQGNAVPKYSEVWTCYIVQY